MNNTLCTLSLACAALMPLAACAAEPPTPVSMPQPAVDMRADVVVDAHARTDAETRARTDAQTKIDAEAARRDLEQMREQMRDLSKRMAEISSKLGDVGPRAYAYHYIGDPQRGMIGVVLGKDEHGLRINAVTPGGPADKAGLKNGDVMVVVNGADVTKSGDAKASQALRDLKVGEDVKVAILRDGRKIDATMKAERREPFDLAFALGDGDPAKLKKLDELQELAELPPDFDKHVHEQVERAAREAERQAERAAQHAQITQEQSLRIAERANAQAERTLQRISLSMPWWGLNLANLNPDLGAYFGTSHGVLVLSADADTSKTLKSGDVLMAISGKPVERPEDALRLLREYPGKDIKVEVLRQRKTQVLSMRAPEFKTMFMPAPPVAPAAPIPPTPPPTAAPRAPAPPAVPASPAPRAEPAALPAPPAPPGSNPEAPRAAPPATNARIA